ncbi:MAG: acireductone synthase [Alphaproteobacteria bacterium]|nr:acireductone synthase [Alphaproteobacteria bacterium]
MTRTRAVVTDIEGTTTPISFVRDVLFPFARARLAEFIAAHGAEPAVAEQLAEARILAGDPAMNDAAVVAVLTGWIDTDRKAAPLKALQGMIWEDGYRRAGLKAPVYADAAEALRRWHAAGLRLAVYSSGSAPAQKLLFGHTDRGDLTPVFSGWFDLATGPKLERGSYAKIAAALGLPPAEILFLSDHPGELAAAVEAGLAAIRVDRGDTPPVPPGPQRTVRSFAEIDPG